MKKVRYTLPFVNKGKAFVLPIWTTQKHEHAMVEAVKATKDKKMDEKEKENMLKYFIILETLQEIDDTVTIENVTKFFIHPENAVEMFNAVYYAGMKDIYFHQVEKPPKNKKDT